MVVHLALFLEEKKMVVAQVERRKQTYYSRRKEIKLGRVRMRKVR